MARFALLIPLLLVASLQCTGQPEARLVGLQGRVHTVLTEYFDYRDIPGGQLTTPTLNVYDPEGYILEEFRYEPDGSVHSHRTYTRKGWQIFKSVTTSVVPDENGTFEQTVNSDGLVTETAAYDGRGQLIRKTTNEFPPKQGGVTISHSQEIGPEGTVSMTETVDYPEAGAGLSRQRATKDGKPDLDWLIQRDASGKLVRDTLTLADGSFNQREQETDGTTTEHRYWAPTKTHTYQTTDPGNHVLEAIEESPSYYVRVTYSYDKADRQIEITNYDRTGKLLSKVSTEHQDDQFGNWVEQKETLWEAPSEPPQSKIVSISRRTITYY